jgi:hypothetical protein
MTSSRRIPITALAAAALLVLTTACGSSDREGDEAGEGCAEQLTAQAVAWLPTQVVLPPGSYAAGESRSTNNPDQRRAKLVVPTDLDTFLTFVNSNWPQAGLTVREGERDEHDTECGIELNAETGAINAVEHVCDSPWTEVELILGQ